MFTKLRHRRMQKYVVRYFKKYPDIKLVVVTGSIGKTQAKISIATVLSKRFRVRLFHGNRGTNFSVPLAVLGIDYPGDITNRRAWRQVFAAARERLNQPRDVDVIVLELNATHLGSMLEYAEYLRPDISVVTAISESNTEVFGSIDYVAQEQLSVDVISRELLIGRDDIEGRFATYLTNPRMNTYGLEGVAEYRFEESDYSIDKGYAGALIVPGWEQTIPVSVDSHDNFSLRQAVAAAAVAVKLGMSPQEIAAGISEIKPLAGRMNRLEGSGGSIIIDDTSNTSPLGVKTALQSLYRVPAPQRVAVISSMKKLGSYSQSAHQEVGMLCDPTQLDWVVTVGDEANRWLAPAARGRGCQVKECRDALEAGAFVHGVIEGGGVALFNGHEEAFLEEAVKVVLKRAADGDGLVRQSPEDLKKKADFFSRFSAEPESTRKAPGRPRTAAK